MLGKEQGYDEFLANRIAQGLAEADKGEGLTLEQSKARAMAVLAKKVQKVSDVEQVAYA